MSSKPLQLLHYTFNITVSAQSLELTDWFISLSLPRWRPSWFTATTRARRAAWSRRQKQLNKPKISDTAVWTLIVLFGEGFSNNSVKMVKPRFKGKSSINPSSSSSNPGELTHYSHTVCLQLMLLSASLHVLCIGNVNSRFPLLNSFL